MPKKIRRSNNRLKKTNRRVRKNTNRNRLKKTNRKVRKTTNRKRLKKFVGGSKHWVAWAEGNYSIEEMTECRDLIKSLTGNRLFTEIENHHGSRVTIIIFNLIELSDYLDEKMKSAEENSIKEMTKCRDLIKSLTGNTLFTKIAYNHEPKHVYILDELKYLSDYLDKLIVDLEIRPLRSLVVQGDAQRDTRNLDEALTLYEEAMAGFRAAGIKRPKLVKKIDQVRQELERVRVEEARVVEARVEEARPSTGPVDKYRGTDTSDFSTPGVYMESR